MEQLRLSGEYTFEIRYQRMFDSYSARFHHHNLITDEGLKFLVGKLANTSEIKNNKKREYNILKIVVGENDTLPKPTDTLDTFIKQDTGDNPFNVNVYSDGAKLKMSTNNLSGRILNGTTEIGVLGEIVTEIYEEDDMEILETKVSDPILISRDTHPVINIPSTCIVTMEYVYNLTSKNNDECTE